MKPPAHGHSPANTIESSVIGTPADIMVIPANVPHEFVFTEDTIDIDIFAPGRQDWLDGTAAYYSK
jgi:quercetin dioxygenase-like cupin family protein